MRIITLTSLFPNSQQPLLGSFILERMAHVSKYSDLQIVAPVPFFPKIPCFPKWHKFSLIPRHERQRGVEVYHPRTIIIPKIGMSFYGFFYVLCMFNFLRKLHRHFPFDLIDAHWVYPDGYAAVHLGRLLGKPVVVSARGSDINQYKKIKNINKKIRYTIKNCDRLIAVSHDLSEVMEQLGSSKEKISVIPNGIDKKIFHPKSQKEARRFLGIPIDSKVIISVGHLVELKGFHLIIDALAQVADKLTNYKYFIIGDGPYKQILQSAIEANGLNDHIFLLGGKFKEELSHWYNAADLFCIASSTEGCPNVIVEALSCGLPVVATAVGGIPDLIKEGETGILVHKRDPINLAKAIEEALLRFKKASVALSNIHSWDEVAKDVVNVFQNVVSSKQQQNLF